MGCIVEHYITRILNKGGFHLPLITAEHDPSKNQLCENVSFEDYVMDWNRMNASALKEMTVSPAHFIHYLHEQQFEKDEEKEKQHFRFGRAAHLALLEPEKFKKSFVAEPDFGTLKSPKNRAERQAFLDGLDEEAVALNDKEMETLTYMIQSIMNHDKARKVLSTGIPESTVLWRDEETGVLCKARPDYLGTEDYWLVDFKSARDVSPGLFANEVKKYRYDLQLAFYYDGVLAVTGREPSGAVIIAVEKTPPYDTCVYMLDDKSLEHGRQWYKWGLGIYKKCYEAGRWPGRQNNRAQILSLPRSADYETFPEFDL